LDATATIQSLADGALSEDKIAAWIAEGSEAKA